MRKCRLFEKYEHYNDIDGKHRSIKIYSDEVYVFHQWAQEGVTKRHPEDPQKDHVYSETYGIVEHPSGQIRCVNPSNIKFISEP